MTYTEVVNLLGSKDNLNDYDREHLVHQRGQELNLISVRMLTGLPADDFVTKDTQYNWEAHGDHNVIVALSLDYAIIHSGSSLACRLNRCFYGSSANLQQTEAYRYGSIPFSDDPECIDILIDGLVRVLKHNTKNPDNAVKIVIARSQLTRVSDAENHERCLELIRAAVDRFTETE